VIIRTKNSEDTLAHAMDGLFSQSFRDFEVLVVDSGSSDGTLSIVEQHPARLIRIRPEDYYPGPVLNQAVAETCTEFVVFQNSDVVPLTPFALERLLEPLLDGRADASFARQVPRPEAETWVRRDYDVAFPGDAPAPEWLPYSLPFAAMRRSCWDEIRFYDSAWGSEDTEWGSRALRRGLRVEYVPAATVMHSHNYTLRQLYGRRFIEGEADAFIREERFGWSGAVRAWLGSLASDLKYHIEAHDFLGLLAAPVRRGVYHWAYLEGRRHGQRRIANVDADTAFGQRIVLDRYAA